MQKSRGSFKLKRLGICLLLGGKGPYHSGLSILIESVASNLFMGIAKFFLKRSRILGTHQLTFDYPCSEFKKRQKMILKQKEQAEKKVRLVIYEIVMIG